MAGAVAKGATPCHEGVRGALRTDSFSETSSVPIHNG
jgi:hypothetical protein